MKGVANSLSMKGQIQAWLWLALYLAATGYAYSWVTRNPWREPWPIPTLSIDASFVMQPAWAIVYATYILLLPVLLYLRYGKPGFFRVLAAGILTQIGQLCIYGLFPTRISLVEAAPPGTLLSLIQALDTQLAAFPSGHVSMPMSLAVAAWIEMRKNHLIAALSPDTKAWLRTAWLYFVWTVLLALSTLFTKQHGWIDVWGGLIFGTAIGWASAPALRGLKWCWHFLFVRPGWDIVSIRALCLEALGAMLALAACIAAPEIWMKAIACVVLATRQHALLVLYHDAVHGLLCKSRRANDFVINALVGIPMLLPVHLYRALHLQHHKALGTPEDPERTLLYFGQYWKYRPLTTLQLLVQIIGDLLLWNNLIMAVRYFRLHASPTAAALPKVKAFPEWIIQAICFWGFVAMAVTLWPSTGLQALGIWLITYATLTQSIQKVRSFAEHVRGDQDIGEESSSHALSNSWQPGWLGRLTLWPYHIHYHREHHALAHVPWHRLPEINAIGDRKPGSALVEHLWRRA